MRSLNVTNPPAAVGSGNAVKVTVKGAGGFVVVVVLGGRAVAVAVVVVETSGAGTTTPSTEVEVVSSMGTVVAGSSTARMVR